jgi:Aminotransferase class I and II
MTAPPRRCRCGHPGEKASRALPSGRPSGLPPRNAPPSAPTPRPGTPTPTATHIVPVTIGDPQKCRAASDLLLARHGIYIQPIDYPTVPGGTERLRIIPTPFHHDDLIDHLTEAMLHVWRALDLPLSSNRPTRTVVANRRPSRSTRSRSLKHKQPCDHQYPE